MIWTPIRSAFVAVMTASLLIGVSAASASSLTAQFEFEKCLATVTGSEHPLGWPCDVLDGRRLVVKYINGVLESKGFSSKGVTSKSPRQLQLRATKDGRRYTAVVAQSGPKVIALRIASLDGSWVRTYRFNVAFEP